MNRRLASQIGERKGGLAIAAIGRAEEREERLVLVDGQELSVTLHPISRGEVKAHDPNFAQVRCSHNFRWLKLCARYARVRSKAVQGFRAITLSLARTVIDIQSILEGKTMSSFFLTFFRASEFWIGWIWSPRRLTLQRIEPRIARMPRIRNRKSDCLFNPCHP